jgi:hypothetical protein
MVDEPDPLVLKWIEWIEGPLVQDVVALHSRRTIWNGITEMARATPGVGDRPSAYWDYNRDCYAVTQAMGIRRVTDLTRGVISLAKLVDEMKTAAKARRFTREDFLAPWAYDELLAQRAEHGWRMFAGGGEHFDPRLAEEDLRTLRRRDVQEVLAGAQGRLLADPRTLGAGRLARDLPPAVERRSC